jgi:hypothetical protein
MTVSLPLCLHLQMKATASGEDHRDLSLWKLALSATRFDLLVATRVGLGEPTSSDARASERWLVVLRSVLCS